MGERQGSLAQSEDALMEVKIAPPTPTPPCSGAGSASATLHVIISFNVTLIIILRGGCCHLCFHGEENGV